MKKAIRILLCLAIVLMMVVCVCACDDTGTNEPSTKFFVVEYTAGEGGTISGATTQNIMSGGKGTQVIAAANEGYEFVRWSDGVTNAERTDTITQNLNFEAQFKLKPILTLIYTAGEGGTISGATTQSVVLGGKGTQVIAVANEGYEFVRWSDGVTTAKRTDTIMQNLNVEAQFELKPILTLKYVASEGGTISGAATQNVAPGERGTLVTAVANEGYEFVRWSDGVTTAKRTDTVMQNLNVEAQFELKTFTLTYIAGEGGMISGKPNQNVVLGEGGTQVIAIADESYEFVRWSDGITTAERTDMDVMSDLNVTAIFKEIDVFYNVILDYSYGNQIYEMRIPKKSEIGLPTPVREGYIFAGWFSDNMEYTGNDNVEIVGDTIFIAKWDSFIAPCIDGEIIANYNDDQLVWNSSMQYYELHLGIDFTSAYLNVYASAEGTVKEIGYDDLDGNYIVLSHKDGYVTKYMSLETASTLKVGAKVKQGQLLGKMSTTQGTEVHNGVHLHFEMYKDGTAINPLDLIVLEEKQPAESV